jgi:hypothetical protein
MVPYLHLLLLTGMIVAMQIGREIALTGANSEAEKSLIQEARQLQSEKKANQRNCQIRTILDSLVPDQRAELSKVLKDESIDSVTITTLLKNRKFMVSYSGVRRHRKHQCSCS